MEIFTFFHLKEVKKERNKQWHDLTGKKRRLHRKVKGAKNRNQK